MEDYYELTLIYISTELVFISNLILGAPNWHLWW
jgi:hypothetical protein